MRRSCVRDAPPPAPPVSPRVVSLTHRAGKDIELFRAEGVKFAHAAAAPGPNGGRRRWLFVDGLSWELPATCNAQGAKRVCALLTAGPSPIPATDVRALLSEGGGGVGQALEALLVSLLDEGFLYALQVGEVDDDDDEDEG